MSVVVDQEIVMTNLISFWFVMRETNTLYAQNCFYAILFVALFSFRCTNKSLERLSFLSFVSVDLSNELWQYRFNSRDENTVT